MMVGTYNVTKGIPPDTLSVLKVYTHFSFSQLQILYEAYKNITSAYAVLHPGNTIHSPIMPTDKNPTVEYFQGLYKHLIEKSNNTTNAK
jgi:hypothetical protein